MTDTILENDKDQNMKTMTVVNVTMRPFTRKWKYFISI